MLDAIQFTYRNVPHSPMLEKAIEKRVDRMPNARTSMRRCQVVLETNQPNRKKADHYHVRLAVNWRGKQILVANRHAHDAKQDAYSAVLDAFNTLEKRVKTLREKRISRWHHRHEHPKNPEIHALPLAAGADEHWGSVDAWDGID